MKKKICILLAGILGIHLFLLTQLKFTAWPEMLLWPYLWIHNLWPYKDIAIAHTPLMLADLTIFFKIFGVGIMQLKIFTWILILIFDGVIFAVVKRLWNTKTAFLALCTFIVWNLFYDGNGLWFDLYVGLWAFCSFYFVRQKKWFWAGFLWAMAFISKQTAIWFLIPIGFELVQTILRRPLKGDPYKVILKFCLGAVLIFIVLLLVMWIYGILPSFYNWAVHFGIFILPKAQGQIQLPDFKNLIISIFPFTIFIPLILKTGKKNIGLALWTFAGMFGAYPRFEYFHFQPALPFLAIATAGFFTNKIWKNPPIKIFATLYITGCVILFGGFFMRNFRDGVRFYETDVRDIAAYVKSNTSPGDKIFVMNWWDNIYPLTNTLPATDPWVPQLSWYQEIPGIQEKEVADLKDSQPKLILLRDYADFGLASYMPQKIYNYVMANYQLKEKIDGVEILIQK